VSRVPQAADFASPPTAAMRADWEAADRAARPARLARLRARFAAAGVDAYFGGRREHMRYLTGFTLADGEEKVAGNSGQFAVSGDEVAILADSRYTIQAVREAPDARLVEAYNDLPARWPSLMASIGARRVAVEAGFVSHAAWGRLAAAAPEVELVPVEAVLPFPPQLEAAIATELAPITRNTAKKVRFDRMADLLRPGAASGRS